MFVIKYDAFRNYQTLNVSFHFLITILIVVFKMENCWGKDLSGKIKIFRQDKLCSCNLYNFQVADDSKQRLFTPLKSFKTRKQVNRKEIENKKSVGKSKRLLSHRV